MKTFNEYIDEQINEKSSMGEMIKKAEKNLDKLGISYQDVKELDKDSYEIALSHEKDAKKLKTFFDDMWIPIKYKQEEEVFFIVYPWTKEK